MNKIETMGVELLSQVPNNVVLRFPGRRFPGVLVQGDSLSILVNRARAICTRADGAGDGALLEDALELRELLEAIQTHYEAVMSAHGMELPYAVDHGVKP